MTVHGLLLAAGAGRRMGTPKALLRDGAGTPFLARAIGVLIDGGCDAVTVVLGASAEDAHGVLDETGWGEDPCVDAVVAQDWDQGMGASLTAGLAAAAGTGSACVLVSLVDLHDLTAEVVRRMLAVVPSGPATLARASYDGVPGHPVLIGRDHWQGVRGSALGDRGARDYLAANRPVLVECGDLATGRDADTRHDLVD